MMVRSWLLLRKLQHFQNFLTKHIDKEQLDLGHLISKVIIEEDNDRFIDNPMEE